MPKTFEIDHAGRADWRVISISEDGKREWCQTYPNKKAAEKGKLALERREIHTCKESPSAPCEACEELHRKMDAEPKRY
jgi:hypothetical protein